MNRQEGTALCLPMSLYEKIHSVLKCYIFDIKFFMIGNLIVLVQERSIRRSRSTVPVDLKCKLLVDRMILRHWLIPFSASNQSRVRQRQKWT